MQKQNQQDLANLQVLGDMSPSTPVITDQSCNNKRSPKNFTGKYLAIQKAQPRRSHSAQHITDILFKWNFYLEKKFNVEKNKSDISLKDKNNLG